MSRHKSFAKIWLAYWLVKPMVPCRKFLGRAKTHDSGARPPSDRAQPSGRTLTCKGSDLADWAASHPPCLAPPDGAGRGAQRARSPRSLCWGGTEPGASLRELMLPLSGLCAGVVAPRSRAAAAASASAICAAVGFVRAIGCPSRTITGTTDRVLSRGYTRSTVPCAARMQRRACHADGSRE